jgi:hypothetical protein
VIAIRVGAAPDQQFVLILAGRAVTMRLRWNGVANRWHMDLVIDDVVVLQGRRVVVGVDLLAPFSLGLGRIFAWPAVEGAQPDYEGLVEGRVALLHATEAEVATALAA